MATFKCKMCGGMLDVIGNEQSIITCDYCGIQQTLPKITDEKKEKLFDRANHLWRNKNYDKAIGVFESILEEDETDAEIYWSILLCIYGIEYVEDKKTNKRIPTINRMQYTSILADENYKSALKYADAIQKVIYQTQAEEISKIQERILQISQKEEPYDVFICYKETDESGKRTADSVLATEIYNRLVREDLRVFFSRITLEDKLGEEYEPYIFGALQTSKVMVVLGTKIEYFNSVWVKNEWSRYHSLIKNGDKKMLITAYKDIDPYDLPDELSLQAADMSKMGFLEDLIHVVLKNVDRNKVNAVKEKENNEVDSRIPVLLKRITIFLENSEWNNADLYCEKVLDIDPENGQAYLFKLLANKKINSFDKLDKCKERLDTASSISIYNNVVKYCDEDILKQILAVNQNIINNQKYQNINLNNNVNNYNSTVNQSNVSYKNKKILIENWLWENKKYFTEEDFGLISNRINFVSDYNLNIITNKKFIDPISVTIISVFFGFYGIDRFLLGDIFKGLIKLFTVGLCGLLWFADIFSASKRTKKKNYNSIMHFL